MPSSISASNGPLISAALLLHYLEFQITDLVSMEKGSKEAVVNSLAHLTVRVQPISQVTDISLTERQRLKDDHFSMSLRFFSLPLGIGPNDRGPQF